MFVFERCRYLACVDRFTQVKLQALKLYRRNATPDSVACDKSHPSGVGLHSTVFLRLARERFVLERLVQI